MIVKIFKYCDFHTKNRKTSRNALISFLLLILLLKCITNDNYLLHNTNYSYPGQLDYVMGYIKCINKKLEKNC